MVVNGSLPNILGGMKQIRKTRTLELELEEATASQPNPMKDESQKAFEE